jgi:hypothetical protein
VCGESYDFRLRNNRRITSPLVETEEEYIIHESDGMMFMHSKE